MNQAPRGLVAADVVTVAVAAILLFLLLVADTHGGAYRLQYFALGGLVILGLLASLVVGARGLPRRPRRVELVALGALAGLAGVSFASILWAEQPAEAWSGSDRMLLYLLLLTLTMVLPWRPPTALFFLTGFVAVVLAVGAVALREAYRGDPSTYIGGRLSYPLGYQNANAVVFLTAYWVALVLATRLTTPGVIRIVLFSAAGALAPIALLSQSRASVIAFVLTAVVLVSVLPGRLRSAIGICATLLPVAVGWTRLLRIRDVAEVGGAAASSAVGRAIVVIVGAAVLLAVVGAIWVAVDQLVRLPQRVVRIANITALVLVALVLAVGTLVVSRAQPMERISTGWNEFTSVSYYGGFGSGLGSNRYDFWRVAIDRFRERPINGIGTDNFLLDYMRERRSNESPRVPHSVELQLMSQLGVIGALLGLMFFVAAFGGAFPRRSDGAAGAAVAAASVTGAIYWLIHASEDWFWEIPGTFAPVIVLLGCAAAVRGGTSQPVRFGKRSTIGVGAVGVMIGAALLVPWWADRLAREASNGWPSDPAKALGQLDRSAWLNPLSSTPASLTGQIEVQLGDLEAAYSSYGHAIGRDPGYWYWHFQRAAAASALGRNADALREIQRARLENPRSKTLLEVERLLRAGERVGPARADALFRRSSS